MAEAKQQDFKIVVSGKANPSADTQKVAQEIARHVRDAGLHVDEISLTNGPNTSSIGLEDDGSQRPLRESHIGGPNHPDVRNAVERNEAQSKQATQAAQRAGDASRDASRADGGDTVSRQGAASGDGSPSMASPGTSRAAELKANQAVRDADKR